MDFNLTDEQKLLQTSFRDFAKQQIEPNAARWDEEDICPSELMPVMGDLGILGIFVPEEYGGVGLGHLERVLALVEIARYSPGVAMMVFTHQLGIAALQEFGTEEQKQKYLPGLCAGTMIGGLASTEPGGGSDIAGSKTTGEPGQDGWVVTGKKCFITNSHLADICIINARVGEDEKGRGVFNALLLEKGMDGFAPGREEHKMGLRGSITGELSMNKVPVPAENLVGPEGKGNAVALKIIGEVGRASMAAICVGILKGCLEESVKFAGERIVYGRPISKLQAIQFHIAENRLDFETARLLLYRAVALKDQQIPATTEFSMAKHFGTEAAVRASKRTIELMGGYGIINEYPLGRFLRDAMTCISSGGTSEIQRIIIAGDTIKKYS